MGLSLNNISLGLSGGFLGYPSIVFGTVMGTISGLLIWSSYIVGAYLQSFVLKPWIHQIGSTLLVLIGLYELIA